MSVAEILSGSGNIIYVQNMFAEIRPTLPIHSKQIADDRPVSFPTLFDLDRTDQLWRANKFYILSAPGLRA